MGNKKKPTDPYQCDLDRPTDRERLQAIYDVLDEYLGDTDPRTDIPWDQWDDDDLKSDYPLLWCCRQLGEIIGTGPTQKMAEPKSQNYGTPQNPDTSTEADRMRDSRGTWDY